MTLVDISAPIYWEDLPIGTRFITRKRTITETDLVSFINQTWLTEELFSNANPDDRAQMSIKERVVPAGLIYVFAEGLVAPSFEASGMAFLNAEIDMKGPVIVGDTIRVQCEVMEHRLTSKPGRGLVRTRNAVLNQRDNATLIYTPLRMMRMRKE